MTLPVAASSVSRNRFAPAGVTASPTPTSKPRAGARSCTSGEFKARAISELSFWMMSVGVPAGAISMNQPCRSTLFSVSEIAHALLASEDSIEKRLGRARGLFRLSGTFEEVTGASEIPKRLEAVYQAIYLLFNEGYHGSRSESTVREDVCFEAIRLALLGLILE